MLLIAAIAAFKFLNSYLIKNNGCNEGENRDVQAGEFAIRA